MKVRQVLLLVFVLHLGAGGAVGSEPTDRVKSAEDIYASTANSVFVLEVRRDDGTPVAFGTSFLVGPRRLITTAHVLRGGKPFVRSGHILLPSKVEKVDAATDLAVLVVDADIASAPLRFESRDQRPGAPVYAIGTPQGLEKTITDGLLTGKRTHKGQPLLQISAPISSGSSGGPIVNADGLVIGVAAAFLIDGQNLNFAIPAEAVIALMNSQTTAAVVDPADAIAAAEALKKQLDEEYSIATADERYSELKARLDELWDRALAAAGSDPRMLSAVCLGAAESYSNDAAAGAGRRLLQTKGSLTISERRATASAIRHLAESPNGGDPVLAAEALTIVRPLIADTTKARFEDLLIAGDANMVLQRFGDATKYLALALRASDASEVAEVTSEPILWKLIEANIADGQLGNARKLFVSFRQRFEEGAYEIERIAEALAKDEPNAAEAAALYVEAGAMRRAEMFEPKDPRLESVIGSNFAQKCAFDNYCEAASLFWQVDDYDRHLPTARACNELADGLEDDENVQWTLARNYRQMSSTLNARGLHDEALSFARKSIELEADNAWAHYHAAVALDQSGRDEDALPEAKTALRLSDGKYASFHFLLGGIYFDLKNWSQAQGAFERAAAMRKEDTDAAYNVALCLQRQGYSRDAARWFEEVLRRNPAHPDGADLRKRIAELKK